jgi:hypothetical protein
MYITTGFLILIYYPNWVTRHKLYGRVKSIQKPIFGVDVESSFASMCTFPLDVISNFTDIAMIAYIGRHCLAGACGKQVDQLISM